jgi:hypothetical protein
VALTSPALSTPKQLTSVRFMAIPPSKAGRRLIHWFTSTLTGLSTATATAAGAYTRPCGNYRIVNGGQMLEFRTGGLYSDGNLDGTQILSNRPQRRRRPGHQ